MDIVVTLLLVAAVAAALLYPLWRPPLLPLDDGAGPASRLAALEERKASLYGAIRDLGFDYRTDKLTEADYRLESEALKSEAVGLVAEIEETRSRVPRGDDRLERRIDAARDRLSGAAPAAVSPEGRFCTECGHAAVADHKFCGACGAPLGAAP